MTIPELTDILEKELPLDESAYAFLRTLLPFDRIQITCELNSRMRQRIARLLRMNFPDWTDDSIQAEVGFRIWTGELTQGLEFPECLQPVSN